jgi:membrane-bound lytic murein transglycosylase
MRRWLTGAGLRLTALVLSGTIEAILFVAAVGAQSPLVAVPEARPGGGVAWVSFSRLVLNQDAGGAIRGPGRIDVFWGPGSDADLAASEMKESGELYFLVPKGVGERAPR